MEKTYEQERQEALAAGQMALEKLYAAQDRLNRAGDWGLIDLLGGGLFSSLMKHSRMDEAQEELEEAKRALCRFSRELADLTEGIEVDIGQQDLLRFADLFFDGMIADWMMQARIGTAKEQVNEAIGRVEEILRRL